jgi:hypothetical protein
MEFSSRGFQRDTTRANTTTSTASSADLGTKNSSSSSKKKLQKIKDNKHISILAVVLSISILILVVAVILGISTKPSENSIVKKDRYQAVFLNGGQAYFGKVKNLNDRYIDLGDIYYISTNGQTGNNQSANISLVKLGSELHCPQDRMVINRDQVLFWENLNDDGKVVNAIKQWQKENPNGQKCNNQTTRQQTTSQDQSTTGTENSTTGTDNSTTSGTGSSTTGNNSTNPTSNSSNSSTNGAATNPTTGTGTSNNGSTTTP